MYIEKETCIHRYNASDLFCASAPSLKITKHHSLSTHQTSSKAHTSRSFTTNSWAHRSVGFTQKGTWERGKAEKGLGS